MRIAIVCPLAAQADGKGYQRRTMEIISSLQNVAEVREFVAEQVSLRQRMRRMVADIAAHPALPVQVAWVRAGFRFDALQASLSNFDLVILMTARVVPPSGAAGTIVDFVDCLSRAALQRAREAGPLGSLLWKWEASRMRRWEREVVGHAQQSIAVSPLEAKELGEGTTAIPLMMPEGKNQAAGSRIVFTGNLRFAPNRFAAEWICRKLAPALLKQGIPPSLLLIAGRSPQKALLRLARRHGVEVRGDVSDMATVLEEAAITIAPMAVATGVQYKILDSVGNGVPVVMSPLAAQGLPLRDMRSALIRNLDPPLFAQAVNRLMADDSWRRQLALQAKEDMRMLRPTAVADEWRKAVGVSSPADPRANESRPCR